MVESGEASVAPRCELFGAVDDGADAGGGDAGGAGDFDAEFGGVVDAGLGDGDGAVVFLLLRSRNHGGWMDGIEKRTNEPLTASALRSPTH